MSPQGPRVALTPRALGGLLQATIVVLLVWVYWSAQVFLLGAEFT